MKSRLTHQGIKYFSYDYHPSSVTKNNLLLPFGKIKYFRFSLPPEAITQDGETVFLSHDAFKEIILIKSKSSGTSPLSGMNDSKDEIIIEKMIQNIPLVERFDVWSEILKNYLDNDEKCSEALLKSKAGMESDECNQIHEKIKRAMIDYNFTSMLCDWFHLGLKDLLDAMMGILSGEKNKLSEKDFESFYWYTMSVANRGEIDESVSQDEIIQKLLASLKLNDEQPQKQ